MPQKKSILGLIQDRIGSTCPNATTINPTHDLDIPEGYVVEIWGVEFQVNGFLDTGGLLEAYLSLDDDITTWQQSIISDDVIFAAEFETLFVTTGAAMNNGVSRVMFPVPVITARDILAWTIWSATNWSAAYYTACVHYSYRKATSQDITELLLRRR